MKNTRIFTGLLCALLLSVVQAPFLVAHEFFVIPDVVKDYKAGDTVQINALSTHYFNVGEELEAAEVNEVYAVQEGKKIGGNLKLEKNEAKIWYQTTYKLANDTPTIIVGNRKGDFYCLFTDGEYADGKKATVAKANPKKTIAKSRYFAKYSKLYLNPAANDASFSTPLGHDIEIIPLSNPAALKKGAKPKFRVLYKGAPLANTEIFATYDSYDPKTENAYAQKSKTNAKGEVSFTFNQSALWIVRISDTRKSSYPDTDEDNISAIAVFMVK
ncbi:MAG: hypothetical protein Ta2G_01170 [Termitinemataceae bacterium]|nr:MAG: hypothetical protein Ta2G_01170 [Termitinemataceae bacterium]